MDNVLLDRLLDALCGANRQSNEGVHLAVDNEELGPPSPSSSKYATALPDWSVLSSEPGRCGSCSRWKATGYSLEGECFAGRRAHGWWDGQPDAPVLTHPAHQCAASNGNAWRPKSKARLG